MSEIVELIEGPYIAEVSARNVVKNVGEGLEAKGLTWTTLRMDDK